MKIKILMCSLLALLLTACGGSDGGIQPAGLAGVVELVCADVNNTPDAQCAQQGAVALAASLTVGALVEIDAGTVTRSQMVYATSEVVNSTAQDEHGYIQMVFDAGCNGSPTWEIVSKQQVTYPAGQTYSMTVGGQCGDMPLGQRTLTATAWAEDGTTELGKVIVSFNLIE